jgi:hypothetical protein
MERLRYPVATLAFLGLVLSLIVHVAAVRGADVGSAHPQVWSLHVGIFVVFLPFVLASRTVFGKKRTWAQMKVTYPRWLIGAGIVLMVYVMANFALGMWALDGGSPEIRDGQYVLQQHGRLLRVLSSDEYRAYKAWEVRMFSGHWLIFYFMPFAFFAFTPSLTPFDTWKRDRP